MRIFYNATIKELFNLRNKVVVDTAIPALFKQGFVMSPFSTAWNSKNNVGDFDYELCRLTNESQLEILEIYVARDDRWIKFYLNIFILNPILNSLSNLKGVDGLQFHLAPNSLTNMRLRIDDIQGVPLLNWNYMSAHKLKRFYTKARLARNIKRLADTIEKDMQDIDRFVRRWHALNHPLKTNWTGHAL